MKRVIGVFGWLAACALIAAIVTSVGVTLREAGENRVRTNEAIEAAQFEEGFRAAQADLPADACPYHGGSSQTQWKKGWIEGRIKLKEKK